METTIGLIVAMLGLIAFLIWRSQQGSNSSNANAKNPSVKPSQATKPATKEVLQAAKRHEPLTAAERKAESDKSFVNAVGKKLPSEPKPKATEPVKPEPIPDASSESAKESEYISAVVSVEPADPKVVEAIDSARSKWAEFEEHFRTHGHDQSTLAKFAFPFKDGNHEGREHMWIQVEEISGKTVRGQLLNAPIHRGDLHEGQIVICDLDDLTDWLYQEGDHSVGAYTESLFRDRV